MKKLKTLATIGITSLAAFGLLLSTSAGPKQQVTRPMHLNGSGVIEITSMDETGTGTWKGTESGQATHLGCYSMAYDGTFVFTSPTTSVWVGKGTYTAANGNHLDFDVTITCDGSGETGVMEFTGGSGRFDGASGSVNLESVTDPVTGAYTISGTGTITY